MVVEAFLGGVATHVGDLSTALAGAGHEVHLLYSDLRADGNAICRLKAAAQSGVRCVRLPIGHVPNVADLRAGALLRQYVHRVGPFDVLHAHSTKAGFLLRLSALGSGSSMVYTPHALMTMDPTLSRNKRWAVMLMERAFASVTDAIVAVSDKEAGHAIGLGIPSRRVFVVPNGVTRAPLPTNAVEVREAIRRNWDVAADEFCVGLVGRLAAQKRPTLAVDAFGLFTSQFVRSKLIVAGRGPLAEQVRDRVDQMKLGGSVCTLGEVPVAEVMPGLDVLLVTSAYEGFPYVLLEAMTYGIPVVTTAIGGTEILITHGENGFIAESTKEIADALARLSGTPGLRARMQRECLVRVAEFSIDRMAEKTLQVYRKTLVRSAA